MSVLIKGMEMPKEAGKYRVEFDQCGNPYLLSDNGDGGIWHIIPVPPHGRLIDADALCDGLVSNHPVAIYAKNAPTIIPPSEEGER